MDSPNGMLRPKQVNGGTAVFQHSPETQTLKKEWEAGCQADEVCHAVVTVFQNSFHRRIRYMTECCQSIERGYAGYSSLGLEQRMRCLRTFR
jgi:hypothetical protein